MERTFTRLVDPHLQSLQGIREVGTNEFFYTSLMARMNQNVADNSWHFPVTPVLGGGSNGSFIGGKRIYVVTKNTINMNAKPTNKI